MNHDRELLHALVRQHLADFSELAFRSVLPGDVFLPNWHLEAIAAVLERVAEGEIKQLAITMPPRYGKSICASVAFPAWLLGRDPTTRIICLSYAQELSIKLANQCRTVMAAPFYRAVFPGTVLSARKNTETEFETTRGGWRLSTSVGGVITGRGAKFLIIDDPIKPADAMSDTVRASVNEWYNLTIPTRLESKVDGAIILIMQRLHADDLVGHLLQQEGWTHLNLAAIAETEQRIRIGAGRFHHRRIGDLLHPEREPRSALERLRTSLGTANFAAQYQQDPLPVGGNMIDWRWFRRFDRPPELNEEGCIVQSWDTASKTGELNDFSVCTTWMMQDNTFYLLDLFRARLDAPNLRRRLHELYELYRPEIVLIEDQGSGIPLIQELQYAGRVYVVPIQPRGDKVMRASAQSARIEAGQVLLPEHAPWLGELQREIQGFPRSTYKDQVDSISQFLIWAADRRVPRIRSLEDD